MKLFSTISLISLLFAASQNKTNFSSRKSHGKKTLAGHKSKSRSQSSSKFKFMWQPTKVKTGVPTTAKSGEEWCKSD